LLQYATDVSGTLSSDNDFTNNYYCEVASIMPQAMHQQKLKPKQRGQF